MRTRTTVLLLSLLLVVASGCRSRRAVPPPPEPVPPVTETVAPEPEKPVEPPRDFEPAPPDPNVLSEDIIEANRQARDRGFIRDAFFPFDASTLDADAQAALTSTARWLRDNTQWRIRVEGHCDERGTSQYNLALGDRRAETAAEFLAAQGVDRSRIETISYGEERPFEEGSTEEAWARNRRAHIVLSGRR